MGQMGVFDKVVKNHIFMGGGGRGWCYEGNKEGYCYLPAGQYQLVKTQSSWLYRVIQKDP